MTLSVIFYPYNFVRTILSIPFCLIPFCPYTILSIPFCPYHFVRYHFVLEPAGALVRLAFESSSSSRAMGSAPVGVRCQFHQLPPSSSVRRHLTQFLKRHPAPLDNVV